MSSSTRLFDSNGHLLPPEKCNIEPLDSLTKHRAASPSRRSPSRNGRQSAGTSGSEPKLPNFVQEVTKNTESSNIRLASPTAIKAEYVNVEKRLISTKNSAKDGTHLANNHLGNTTASNFKARYCLSWIFCKLLLIMHSSVFWSHSNAYLNCNNYVF